MRRFVSRRVLFVVLAAWAAACSSGEPLRVTALQVGRSLNADKTVGGHTTRFKPTDTIYASVLTAGGGEGKITARWFYAGRMVNESTRDVDYNDAAATEFFLSNPVGFPTGDYRIEVLFNGEPAFSRDLRVER